MAHIVSCIKLEADGDQSCVKSYIAKQLSIEASMDSLDKVSISSVGSSEEKKPYTWRMHQPETRKYQLFPKERQLPPVAVAKQLDQEHLLAMKQNGEKPEKTEKTGGLRQRMKEHNLIRRRKVSLADLGPMTTVQEVPMDSPTIPGRPALHERSISTPVNSIRQHRVAETTSAFQDWGSENTGLLSTIISPAEPQRSGSAIPKWPLLPKSLAPLVIPTQNGPRDRLPRQLPICHGRSGSTPVEPSYCSAKADESPRSRMPFTPYTPTSAFAYITTPKSAATSSTLPTPISATTESQDSPHPVERTPFTTPQLASTDQFSTPKAECELTPRSGTALSHRKNQSESGSIMERGRPRKRSDGAAVGLRHKRTDSKRSKSADRRAFETLPRGWRPSEARKMIDQSEAEYLQQQALGQAFRFDVLKKDDVENLSRELRRLDERTDYLRRTYTSLRAGRRNLHARVCQYLRSPRTVRFNQDSMLRQEEALAELDTSIDDWVSKLEHAENRRTRVRQKLLEHVAAAATMAISSDVAGVSESLRQAVGVRVQLATEMSTPPRSPNRTDVFLHAQTPSPSPQRVVARVPSAILEAPVEEAANVGLGLNTRDSVQSELQRVESIRIYADNDVYALLADVESEFTTLSGDGMASPEPTKVLTSEDKERELHRARSHGLLNGIGSEKTEMASLVSGPVPSPPLKNSPVEDGAVFLTAAVFQPNHVTARA